MTKVFLVSEDKIKSESLVSNNIDGKYLQVAISNAQEIDLCNLLGKCLYDKIISLVSDGSIQTAPSYKMLLDDYIQPYLINQIMCTIQIAINYKFTNSGTIQNQDDKKSSVDYSTGKALASQYEKYANSYATRMKDFIVSHIQSYPEYRQMKDYEYFMDAPLCDIFLDDIPTRKYNYKYK